VINDIFDEPVAFATVILAIATFIAAWYSSKSAQKSANQAKEMNALENKIKENLGEANLLHKQAVFAQQIAQLRADKILRNFHETRADAAKLLAALEIIDHNQGPSKSYRQSAIEAKKRLSLTYPPNTKIGEEINMQLEFATRILFGREDPMSHEALKVLRMNLWLVVNHERKRSIAAVQGSIVEDWESLTPYIIADVP
jgi:hypothetical protein